MCDVAGRGPCISVAMTSCNGAAFVAEQLASIRAQSQPPTQVVVCDDRSDDDTVEIVTTALAGAPFDVEVVQNRERLGVVPNVAQAISRATGDVIVLADHDDIWRPYKLARLAERFRAKPKVDAVFSNAMIIDRHSRPTGQSLWSQVGFSPKQHARWRADPLAVLMRGNVVTGAALAFRTSMRDLVLPIPPHGWHDLWIAYLTAATSQIEALDEALLSYRIHDRNTAGLPSSRWRELNRRLTRPEERYDNLMQMEALIRRLEERGWSATTEVGRLRAKARHQQFRVGLPANRVPRAAAVLGGVIDGSYGQFSAGPSSALFDLAYGGRFRRLDRAPTPVSVASSAERLNSPGRPG